MPLVRSPAARHPMTLMTKLHRQRRTTFKGDTDKVDESTCRGGKDPAKSCLKGFGGPLCARCDGSNSFQMDRNKENIDYTNGCMKCNDGQIGSARLKVLGYVAGAIVLAVVFAMTQEILTRCARTYLPFVFKFQEKIKGFRDKGKIMLTYCQVRHRRVCPSIQRARGV